MNMTLPHDKQRIVLPNSLVLNWRDESRRYFGDYHLVRVHLSVSVPLEARFFDTGEECRAARELLPDPLIYNRLAEKMGVPSADVAAVRTSLVDDLLRHAGGYLGSVGFPRKFIRSELQRVRTGRGKKLSAPVYRSA